MISEQNVIEQFKNAMLEAGITPPDSITADGNLHRFKIKGKLDGAYVLHLDGRAAGYFQDFKQGIKENWKLASYNQRLTDEQRKAYAQQRQAEEMTRQKEELAKHEAAANKARSIWDKAPFASEHPYLARKRIKPHRTKLGVANTLIIPIFNIKNELVNLQFISEDGTKRFLSGGQKKGCFYRLGMVTERILIAEGFATAASIYESIGHLTIVAFDAGNLEPVAEVIRTQCPTADIIIMADNDESGIGQTKARQAALK